MDWHQFWFRYIGDEPLAATEIMKRCDPLLQRFGAVPAAPKGIPIKSADGTFEVRLYGSIATKSIIVKLLSDAGFQLEREVSHTQGE